MTQQKQATPQATVPDVPDVPARTMRAGEAAQQAASPTKGKRKSVPSTTRRPSGVKMKKAEREQAQAVFLDVFASSAIITVACRAANVARQTVHAWLEHDETFSLRYHVAERTAEDVIRSALHQHAIVGWDEVVVSMGKVVYVPDGGVDRDGKPTYKPLTQHKYDSARLAQMAAARLPEYKPAATVRHVELTGKDGGPIEVQDARALLDTRLAALADRERARGTPGDAPA